MCYPLKYIQQNKFCKKKVNFSSHNSTSCSLSIFWLAREALDLSAPLFYHL